MTGGDVFFHPRYNVRRDHHIMRSEVRRVLQRQLGYNCSVRIRCSTGLHVSSYLSPLFQPTPESLSAGALSADSSISGLFSHSGNALDDRRDLYIQAAVLYTTVNGKRRVRVCNVGIRPSTLAGNVFKLADQDVGVCLMVKQGEQAEDQGKKLVDNASMCRTAVLAMNGKMLTEIRESLTQQFVDLLVAYRRNCAASTAPTQVRHLELFRYLLLLTWG